MTKLEAIILNWLPVRKLLGFAKKIHPVGFEGFSLYDVGAQFVKDAKNHRLNERSAAVTYNFLMAIPPTLLFLISLIPILPISDVKHDIHNTILQVMPATNIRDGLLRVIDGFLKHQRKDFLSFGVLLTLYFSSNGMMGLMRSFDRSLHVYVKRSQIIRRWTAIKLTIMLICVAIISIGVVIIQTSAVNGFLLKIFHTILVVKLLSLVIVMSIIFCCISIIYTYGPSLTNRFRFVSPGSIFATFAIGVSTIVFFFAVNNFLHYNQIYGPIGTLIAFMVWIWLNTFIILLGYELNVSILLSKTVHEQTSK